MATCSVQPTVLHSVPTRSAARPPPSEPCAFSTRRQTLFLVSSALLHPSQSLAEDIPLFGIRKKLKKAEEEAEAIVKEGFEAAEKGVEAAERGVEAIERGVVAAEKGVEEVVSFGGLAQAGTVAAVEVFGLVVAMAIVNGIIGPEDQRS